MTLHLCALYELQCKHLQPLTGPDDYWWAHWAIGWLGGKVRTWWYCVWAQGFWGLTQASVSPRTLVSQHSFRKTQVQDRTTGNQEAFRSKMANSPQRMRTDQSELDMLGLQGLPSSQSCCDLRPHAVGNVNTQASVSSSVSGVHNATSGKILRMKWESYGNVVMTPGMDQELPFPAQDSQLESSVFSSLSPFPPWAGMEVLVGVAWSRFHHTQLHPRCSCAHSPIRC